MKKLLQATTTLSILLFTGSCAEYSAQTKPNVVLICLDTVRADHLGCYGFQKYSTTPTLDALAEESWVFQDTSATASWTKPSVPSYMTGTYPIQHGVYEGSARAQAGKVSDVLPESATTLAEVFSTRGYETTAIVENAQLRRGNGFAQGFDHYDDRGGSAQEIRWKASDFLDDRDPERPFFLYLHFLDAHWPFDVPLEYTTKFGGDRDNSIFRGQESRALRDAINHGHKKLTQEELESLDALYSGAIRYIDDQLARLIRSLEARGLKDNTILCVVSDHGEEFLEHGRVGHGHGLWENLLAVPWILHVPGAPARQIETNVSLVDLFPTLLAAAAIAAPESHTGVDRIDAPDKEVTILAEHKEPRAYVRAIRSGRQKTVERAIPLDFGEASRELHKGEAWEIKLAVGDSGNLRATELQPGDSDSPELELKARVSKLGQGSLELVGVPVSWNDETIFYGKIDSAKGLAVGLPVKIKGHFEGGVLLARRVKGYERDLRFEPEVRAPLGEFTIQDGTGTVRWGSLVIQVDEKTHWDLPKPRMTRDSILALAADGTDQFSVTQTRFDLHLDPEELAAPPPSVEQVDLQSHFRALAGQRFWTEGDRRQLDSETLEALRAIGYVK